jgi:hypothetical protein
VAAIDTAMAIKLINATTPTSGSAGQPGTWTALGAGQMKVRLFSTTPANGTAAGTEITTGGGYTTGGQAITVSSTTATSVANVATMSGTFPAVALTWANSSGSAWTINSFDLVDNAGLRTWYGAFNGAPISVASGNSFQIAVGGITISLS